MSQQVLHFIDGQYVSGASPRVITVTNPANNQAIASLNCASDEQVLAAIASAKLAFSTWRDTPVSERARVMLRYQHLLKEHHDELASILAQETGKTFEDAKGDVWRGIEVAEHACNIASLSMGETVENVARQIDTYSYTQPLGVCAGITPFNFPAMIPLWMFPLAIACGNTFVLKPSEQGARCLLDGSEATVAGFEAGNWVGPTLFDQVTTDMSIYTEEIFGPVLCCMCVDTLEEAIALVNASPYGNGTSIFTASGGAARKYQHEIEVGQVGINVPIPVPLPFFSFTGWKGSFYGDQHAYGKQAVRFFTETKTITARWFDDDISRLANVADSATPSDSSSAPNMTIALK